MDLHVHLCVFMHTYACALHMWASYVCTCEQFGIGAHGMYARVGMHTCASFIEFPRAHECLCQPRLVFGAGSDCEWL